MHLNSKYVETKETEGWDVLCECGSPLHVFKVRGIIDTIDRDYVCKSCGNRYNEYRLKYPSDHTSYNYSVDGVFTKI